MKKNIYFLLLVIITPLISAQNNRIEITFERNADNSIDFFYSKNLPGSYTLKLELTSLVNSYNKRIYTKVLKYGSGSICTISPIDKNKSITFGYKSSYKFGDSNPKVSTDIHYSLPFIEGKDVKIMEASFLGETYFGNKKPIGWKSFTAFSQTSDTICSIRKGKVVNIINEHKNDSTLLKIYTSRRNQITIEHDDGTYAKYIGFDKNKIFVKLGQDVYPQTRLGTLEIFNKINYRLDFNVYHFLEDRMEQPENETLANVDYKVKFLNPLFITDKGLVQIESGQDYKTTFNEAILLQEVSRKEKKKYKKNPRFYY